MRLRRLTLERFGHLAGVELDFADGTGLHVVAGQNEAGKTTALAAIGDALWGVEGDRYAPLNEPLRIGFDVCAGSAQGSFTRLKKRQSLLDASGSAVPDTALDPFRGGLSRKDFDRMFGLSAERLRAGGEAILAGDGELGATLFEASSGLAGVREVATRLKAEADALYTKRRAASRAFYVAADRHAQARRDALDRALRSDVFEAERRQLLALEQAWAEDVARASRLDAERSRLERVRRTARPLGELERAHRALEELGPVRPAPPDAEKRREDAVLERRMADDARTRALQRRDALKATLAGLPEDSAALMEAEEIDWLGLNLQAVEQTRADRLKQEAAAAQHARGIVAAASEIGLEGSAEDIAARLPGRMPRDKLRAALNARTTLDERLRNEAEALELAERKVADNPVPLGPPADESGLRRAVEAAQREGPVDAEHDRLNLLHGTLARRAALALSEVPDWSQSIEALRATVPPVTSVRRTLADALAESGQRLEQHRVAYATAQQMLVAAEDQRAEATRDGTLPTDEAVEAVRRDRDATWRAIRLHWIEGGAAPPEAVSLPDRLADLVWRADRLADRRVAEAQAIEEAAEANRARERCATQVLKATTALHGAEAAHAASGHAWHETMAAAGLPALAPAAMTEWLELREAALQAAETARRGADDLSAIERRRTDAIDRLRPFAPGPADRLSPNLDVAEELLKEAGRTALAQRELATAAKRADAEWAERRVVAERGTSALRSWIESWPALVAAFGLPGDATPGEAETAASQWGQIAAGVAQWRTARDRVDEMTAAIDAFDARALALSERIAPDLGGAVHARVTALSARLAQARRLEQERARLAGELDGAGVALMQQTELHDRAASALASLCELVHVTHEDELPGALERARRSAELTRIAGQCEAELQLQGEGLDPATLAAQAAGFEPDQAQSTVEALKAEIDAIRARQREHSEAIATGRATLASMTAGRDAGEAAQRAEDAAAEAGDVARRYARVRLAAGLLDASLKRFRQDQQAPLLARAGHHFAALTCGRYGGLETDENAKGDTIVVGRLASGGHCPVDRLSEATRDQLALALRLAAIEAAAADRVQLPLVADDLLASFDEERARAGLAVLAAVGATTQVILFTHHAHIAAMVTREIGKVHRLPAP